MTSAIANKKLVEATWKTTCIQEAATMAMVNSCAATMAALDKAGPEAFKIWQQATVANRVAFLKERKAATPLEIVTAIAEFETNVFGSKINIWGDDKEAHLEYIECACYLAMQKCGQMDKTKHEKMAENWTTMNQEIAKVFGLKGAIDFTKPNVLMSFTK